MKIFMKNLIKKTIKKNKRQKHPCFQFLHIFALAAVILIGSYGIITAPASDRSSMEAVIRENARKIAQDQASSSSSERSDDASGSPAHTRQGKQEQISSQNGVSKNTAEEKNSQKGKHPSAATDSISVIGDSVFLCAAPDFKKMYPQAVIDAKISRQVFQAIDIVKQMKAEKKLGQTVILALGNNGNFNPATGEALLNDIGTKRKIFWIMPYGSDVERSVYKTIRKVTAKYKNVTLIPWDKEAPKHPSWFYQDGTHPNPSGAKEYAKFVRKYLNAN